MIKQNWRSGQHTRMEMGWWNASLSMQTQTVRGMNEHTPHTEQTAWGTLMERGGGPLSARVSLVLSHFPSTFLGELFAISSNSSSLLVW